MRSFRRPWSRGGSFRFTRPITSDHGMQPGTHSFPNEQRGELRPTEGLADISKSNWTNDHKGIPNEPLTLLRISTSCSPAAGRREERAAGKKSGGKKEERSKRVEDLGKTANCKSLQARLANIIQRSRAKITDNGTSVSR